MDKRYKHTPHRLKRRIIKKDETDFSRYKRFLDAIKYLEALGKHDIAREWKKVSRERIAGLTFYFVDSLCSGFVWADSVKGNAYWNEANEHSGNWLRWRI